jgi:hypothetical protein
VNDSLEGRAFGEDAGPMRWSWLRSKRRQVPGEWIVRDPRRGLCFLVPGLLGRNSGAEALHKVNAKTAGPVLPSLPNGLLAAGIVLADTEALHPLALGTGVWRACDSGAGFEAITLGRG